MLHGRMLFVLCMIGALVLLPGCARLRPYHTVNTISAAAGPSTAGVTSSTSPCYEPGAAIPNDVCVRFVEFDDFGNLFNRAQLDQTVEAAGRVAATGGIVVVFTHGWKHNAKQNDSNLIRFHAAMQQVRTVYRQISPWGKREILGIYVGWRGASLNLPILNNLTFWERKTTAQAVGDGAVFELFRKLANHRVVHPTSRLVLIGHSFGAAITYSSVSHSILSQIIDDPHPGDSTSTDGPTVNEGKRWDMVVLINPAFEAMQLRPHLSLARSRRYKDNQLPHLIMITSTADWATGKTFPAGRFPRSLLNKYSVDAPAAMYRSAVGHYIPFVTHQLAVQETCPPPEVASRPALAVAAQSAAQPATRTRQTCFDDPRALYRRPENEVAAATAAAPAPAAAVMLTRCDAPGDCEAVAGQHYMDAPPFMPIWNIRSTGDLMRDHNDIWNPTMHSFLVQMLLLIVEQGTPAAAPAPAAAPTVAGLPLP